MRINKNFLRNPKIRRKMGSCFFLILFTCVPAVAQTVNIGYIFNKELDSQKEIQAGFNFLKSLEDVEVVSIPLENLTKRSLEKLDVLWYHRPDSIQVSSSEKRIGKAVKQFVNRGGDLLLTLDAVRVLNDWEIEKVPITSTTAVIKDEGFGRKLGFHGFRSHPIFNELHGGAYTWHSKTDHTVRKVGFFDDQHPQGPQARIIGIDWAYITYFEDSKLLWEYTLGKGNILAVGAYTYFSKPNFNQDQLHKFIRNGLEYLQGNFSEEKALFWTYDLEDPVIVDLDQGNTLDQEQAIKDTPWEVIHPDLTLSRAKATDNYWDLPGTRLFLAGKEKGGFDELWAHPFMAFRDFVTGVQRPDSEDIIWLNTLTPSVIFSPGVMERSYELEGGVLREITTVAVDDTQMLVHYQWQGKEAVKLFVTATTNLRFMWPYSAASTGTIGYEWSEGLNALLVTDLKTRSMNSLIGFNQVPEKKQIGQFEKFGAAKAGLQPIESNENQISAGFEFTLSREEPLNVSIAAGELSMDTLIETYKELQLNPEALLDNTMNYYADLEKNVMKIVTPDSVFNEGFKWAMAGADQFLVETPGVGKSLVAGYGTTASGWNGGHAVSGRPGYAWYFGRDAQWSGFALNAYGDFENVKEILKTFNTYQNINGKIYHELSTSGSVHYDASDATPLYIMLASHYLKASGDKAFIRKIWKNLEKAMAYCYTTDTDGDGFIENTNVGHGWIEGGDLYGAHTTFYLAGLWVAALREASYLAEVVGEDHHSDRYQKDYKALRTKLNKDFWNSEKKHFQYGLLKDGSYNEEITMLPAVPIYFNTVDRSKAEMTTQRFASGNISTDWGVRILEEKSPYFNPGGYHVGSVWPLFTGWTALAEYETGRYNQGFTHFMNNLVIYKDWDLGSISEVLHGMTYTPSGVTHNQGWSQTMVLQPILEGMLGIKPDALNNHLDLSPRLPWHWEKFSVENVRFGNHYIDMDFRRNELKTIVDLTHKGNGSATLSFHPVFPWGTKFQSVSLGGKNVDFSVEEQGGGVTLVIKDLKLDSESILEIEHRLGYGVLPLVADPVVGASSKGMKIIKEEVTQAGYTLILEGRPGTDYPLDLFSYKKPVAISGASYIGGTKNLHQLKVSFPESTKNYEIVEVLLKFD